MHRLDNYPPRNLPALVFVFYIRKNYRFILLLCITGFAVEQEVHFRRDHIQQVQVQTLFRQLQELFIVAKGFLDIK